MGRWCCSITAGGDASLFSVSIFREARGLEEPPGCHDIETCIEHAK
jgi:hypothetical protein